MILRWHERVSAGFVQRRSERIAPPRRAAAIDSAGPAVQQAPHKVRAPSRGRGADDARIAAASPPMAAASCPGTAAPLAARSAHHPRAAPIPHPPLQAVVLRQHPQDAAFPTYLTNSIKSSTEPLQLVRRELQQGHWVF